VEYNLHHLIFIAIVTTSLASLEQTKTAKSYTKEHIAGTMSVVGCAQLQHWQRHTSRAQPKLHIDRYTGLQNRYYQRKAKAEPVQQRWTLSDAGNKMH